MVRQNQGVAASPPGHSGSAPDPVPGSGHSASVPNAAHVIMRSTGEYSDRDECAIMVFLDQGAAMAFVEAADQQWREVYAANPPIDPPDNGLTDAEWDKLDRRQTRRRNKIARLLTLDPSYPVGDYQDQYDGPTYYSVSVPLASAMSAGTAETAQQAQGQRPASAVPEGQTPNPSRKDGSMTPTPTNVSERLRADDQEHRRIHHKGKGCDRCKAADAIDALSDALAQIGAETDTVADFEGIRFRNFALARLRGEAANLWDTPATLSPPLPSLEVERLRAEAFEQAALVADYAVERAERDWHSLAKQDAVKQVGAEIAEVIRAYKKGSALSALPPLEDRL